MKKSNVIFFIVIILVIIAIFGFAIWDANRSLNEINPEEEAKQNSIGTSEEQNMVTNTLQEGNTISNEIQTNMVNPTTTDNYRSYRGQWYISQEAYQNGERVENLMDRREERLITEEEFQTQLESMTNNNIVELEVDDTYQNSLKFDFEVTSPAPTQREARLDDVMIEINENVGTFTYTDNWGTSGNGTITLKENSIELRLETTSVAQGALWGVEGVYTFSYQVVD